MQVPKRIIKYLLFTFITSWFIEYIGYRDLNSGSGSFGRSMAMAMLMPTLGALFAGARFSEMGWIPEIRGNIKPFLFVWIAPTVFQIAGAALYFLVFPSDLDFSGALMQERNPELFQTIISSGHTYGGYVAAKILSSMISFNLIGSVMLGLCEEIGWRGFLYPELDLHFGRTKACLLGGVIHGVWHFPLMLLFGYEYGEEYIGAPVLGLLAFTVFTTTTGIISYHFYRKTESIWLPALYHGAMNIVFDAYLLRGTEHPEHTVLGPRDIGLIAVIPAAVFAGRILYLEHKREQMELTAAE